MARLQSSLNSPPRRGVVLLAVLVVVVLLTLAAYQFSEYMLGEYRASVSFTKTTQSRAFADSGLSYASLLLSDPNLFESSLGGNPFDNPQMFQSIAVGDGTGRQGYFSVISPPGPDDDNGNFRYGVTDEAGKINLNGLLRADSSGTLAVQILTNLGMPEDTANAILDWIDEDDTPRANGAENEFYGTQIPSYRAKNGPLDTLEELLFVRGVTPQLLFGTDRNRNGVLDADESNGGERDLGWSAFLTVYSREQNIDNEGTARVYVNDTDTNRLYDSLSEAIGQEMTNYILAYRTFGPASTTQPPSGPTPVQKAAADLTKNELRLSGRSRARRLASIFELANTEVLIAASNPQQPATRVVSPLNNQDKLKELLPNLLDKLTTTRDTDLPSRVNVNTAPRQVLLALPGLNESYVDTMLSARPAPGAVIGPDPIFQTPAWLLTEANLPVDALRTLERFVTARTQVYRLQVVGHFAQRGPTMRVEAIVDTNRGRPRIVYWRDLSELGRGFNLPGVNTP